MLKLQFECMHAVEWLSDNILVLFSLLLHYAMHINTEGDLFELLVFINKLWKNGFIIDFFYCAPLKNCLAKHAISKIITLRKYIY